MGPQSHIKQEKAPAPRGRGRRHPALATFACAALPLHRSDSNVPGGPRGHLPLLVISRLPGTKCLARIGQPGKCLTTKHAESAAGSERGAKLVDWHRDKPNLRSPSHPSAPRQPWGGSNSGSTRRSVTVRRGRGRCPEVGLSVLCALLVQPCSAAAASVGSQHGGTTPGQQHPAALNRREVAMPAPWASPDERSAQWSRKTAAQAVNTEVFGAAHGDRWTAEQHLIWAPTINECRRKLPPFRPVCSCRRLWAVFLGTFHASRHGSLCSTGGQGSRPKSNRAQARMSMNLSGEVTRAGTRLTRRSSRQLSRVGVDGPGDRCRLGRQLYHGRGGVMARRRHLH